MWINSQQWFNRKHFCKWNRKCNTYKSSWLSYRICRKSCRYSFNKRLLYKLNQSSNSVRNRTINLVKPVLNHPTNCRDDPKLMFHSSPINFPKIVHPVLSVKKTTPAVLLMVFCSQQVATSVNKFRKIRPTSISLIWRSTHALRSVRYLIRARGS